MHAPTLVDFTVKLDGASCLGSGHGAIIVKLKVKSARGNLCDPPVGGGLITLHSSRPSSAGMVVSGWKGRDGPPLTAAIGN